MSDKKLAGVWIDTHKAIVVSNHDAQSVSEFEVRGTVKAEIQHGNSNENAAHNAEHTNRIKFFKGVEHLLTNSVEAFITGPGKIQEELKHHLESTPQYKNLKVSLGTAQDMSEEKVLETVKEHFHA